MRRTAPRILTFAGSIRAESLNTRLAALFARTAAIMDAEVTVISLADYPLPLYDGDLEAAKGIPAAADKLRTLLLAHHGVFIASPEYNQSLPPLLKNTLDWLSRIRAPAGEPDVWRDRVFAIGSASPGAFGGVRGLLHLRQVLELGLGARVLSEQMVLPAAGHAFAAGGGLTDERAAASLERLARALVEEAGRLL
jgi:NAD(P)H-dependent FMN reductase